MGRVSSRRLEVVAVAGLLWISSCVLGWADFIYFVFLPAHTACCKYEADFFVILRVSMLVSGDLGFQIWGFSLCGEASLFLSDIARLWVFLTSRGQSDKRYSWGT